MFQFYLRLTILCAMLAISCKAKFHSVNKAGPEGATDGTPTSTDTSQDQTPATDRSIIFTANDTPGALQIDPGTDVVIEWLAQGYDTCEVKPLNQNGTSGTQTLKAVNSNQNLSITCQVGTISETVPLEINLKISPTGPIADLKINGQDNALTVAHASEVKLSWTSERATDCILRPINLVGLSGQSTIKNISASSVFTLTCTNASGTSEDSIAVNVNTPPAPTGEFKINGSGGPVYISSGSSITITWSTQNANTCSVNPGAYSGTSGTQVVANITANQQYTLYCEGPGGTLSADIMVYLNNGLIGTLDLKVNGADGIVSVPYASDIRVTWTSDKATKCSVVLPSKTFDGLSGNETVANVRGNLSILMMCNYPNAPVQYDYVSVVAEAAPSPTVALRANGSDDYLVITPGNTVVLVWQSENAQDCEITPGNFSGTSGTSSVANLSQTTTFIATCSGAGGIAVDTVVVHVNTTGTPEAKTPTADLKINGQDGPVDIATGSDVTATWTSTGTAQCTLAPGDVSATSGTQVFPKVMHQSIYVLSCSGAGGSVVDMVTVRTNDNNTDPKTAAPFADLKVNGSDGPIKAFKGDTINLQWWSARATSCEVNPGFYSGPSGAFAYQKILFTTTFVLHCSGPGGDVIDAVTVNIDSGNLAPLVDLRGNGSDGPLVLNVGQPLKLTWVGQFASECKLSPLGIDSLSGSTDIASVAQSQIYTFACNGVGGHSVDTLVVNVNKPIPGRLSCNIFIYREGQQACGPNRYERWWLWIQEIAPTLENGKLPSSTILGTAIANGTYGLSSNNCNNGSPVPMPLTYGKGAYNYSLWTNGVAGSADCAVFTTTYSPLILSFGNTIPAFKTPANGVVFDLESNQKKTHFSWPEDGQNFAFLAYDKNGDGMINNANELFGSNTLGPDQLPAANGFETLKKFDANRDGKINAADPIFQRLLLWFDANSDGVSTAEELVSINSRSIKSIDLHYTEAQQRLDQYGNESRQSSSYTLLSGKSLPIVDYWLVAGAEVK